MRSTYRNDNNLTQYPFADDCGIPFPPGIIHGLCVTAYAPSRIERAYVTAVELGPESVSATICVDSIYIATVKCDYNGWASGYGETSGGIKWNAAMSCGACVETAIGSYTCNAPLAPDCLIQPPASTFSRLKSVTVNGTVYDVGERLNIDFNGYFAAGASEALSYGSTVSINADVPDGAILIDSSSDVSYTPVRTLNGVPVNDFYGLDGKLTIQIAAPESATEGVDPATYITCELLNAASTVITDPYSADPDASQPAGARNRIWCNLNDKLGDTVILTINGTSKIPHCYGSDDESEDIAEEEL